MSHEPILIGLTSRVGQSIEIADNGVQIVCNGCENMSTETVFTRLAVPSYYGS
jgi:hypothetical protein